MIYRSIVHYIYYHPKKFHRHFFEAIRKNDDDL